MLQVFVSACYHTCYLIADLQLLEPPEPGGYSSRELLKILDNLRGLNVIGANVVEVAPVYDNRAETTVLIAAQIILSLVPLMVETPVKP